MPTFPLGKGHHDLNFKFLQFFAFPSSSRHEKCCRLSERIFCQFQCSRNISWSFVRRQILSSKSTSKNASENLSNQNKLFWWYQKNSSFWHFNSHFLLKTKVHLVFVMITEIFWRTFWRHKWQFLFDVVKDSSFCGIPTIYKHIVKPRRTTAMMKRFVMPELYWSMMMK